MTPQKAWAVYQFSKNIASCIAFAGGVNLAIRGISFWWIMPIFALLTAVIGSHNEVPIPPIRCRHCGKFIIDKQEDIKDSKIF